MTEKPDNARSSTPVVVWFRDDLRVADHPALSEAVTAKRPVICLYVLDETPGLRPLGGVARWWLAGALRALAKSLADRGGNLVLRRGAAAESSPSWPMRKARPLFIGTGVTIRARPTTRRSKRTSSKTTSRPARSRPPRQAGNGSRAAAPTQRPTSACSIQPFKRRSSIRAATTFAPSSRKPTRPAAYSARAT
jgi:hypothetical protein